MAVAFKTLGPEMLGSYICTMYGKNTFDVWFSTINLVPNVEEVQYVCIVCCLKCIDFQVLIDWRAAHDLKYQNPDQKEHHF